MEEYREFTFFRGKVRFRQSKKYRFSIIHILFVENLKGIRRSSKVLDLGAGFGALSILITLKHGCRVYALERDPLMLELLKYNVKVNGLEDRIEIIEGDLRDYRVLLKRSYFDCVVTNPPFYTQKNANNPYHFESDTKLKDFVDATSYTLRDGGYLNLLIPANRLHHACKILSEKNISMAYVRFFHPKEGKEAKLVKISCIKNANSLPVVEKPLIINTYEGGYTPEVQRVLDFMI